jgi:aromatic ring-opening dioxygenase LigB subunit
MADNGAIAQPQGAEGDAQQRGTINLVAQNAKTSYANLAVLTTTPEEVVLNFGINVTPMTQDRKVNVEITDRIIMSYPSAKRLAITLGNVVKRYEEKVGVIDVGSQTVSGGAAAAPPQGGEPGQ